MSDHRQRGWWVVAIVMVLAVLVGAIVVPRIVGRRGDARAIQATYQQYEAAWQGGNPTLALNLTGADTRGWIMQMYRAAISENAAALRSRPLHEQFFVLDLRQLFNRSELERTTEDKALARYGDRLVKNAGKSRAWEAVRVEISGDRATASLGWKTGKTTTYAVHNVVFTRSANGWQVNPHTIEAGIMTRAGTTLSRAEVDRIAAESWPDTYGVPFRTDLWNGPRP